MRHLRHSTWLVVVALTAWTSLSASPAFAITLPAHVAPTEQGGAHAEDPHAAAGGHGDAADGEHAAAGEHHVDYTGDDDHDGVPNWRDPKNGEEPNEAYMPVTLGWHLFNLSLLLGLLVYVARRPVLDGIKNRAMSIRKELTDAARSRDEARQRHDELGVRLNKFEEEVRELRAEAEAAAKAEEAKLIQRAHAEAERVKQTAERNIRDELARAQFALRKEAVDLAVQLAEQTLRREVAPADQKRLAKQFLDTLNDDGVNGHG